MKWNELKASGGQLAKQLGHYKWIVLLIAVGLLLLAFPSGGEKSKQGETTQGAAAQFDLAETEAKFAKALSEIADAGEVTVVLSVKSGARQLLAEDRSFAEEKGGVEESSTTVLISRGSGVQEAVKLQDIYPQFQGALIISSGGGDPTVRLKLTEATAALTGLGADKISICKRGK